MTATAEISRKVADESKPQPPAGWRRLRLGDGCAIQNGYAFDSVRFSRTRGTPLIRIRDLKTNSPSENFDGEFDPSYLIQAGSLLIGMDGEFICYRWQGPPALLNQRVCRLLPDAQTFSPDFLFYALNDYLKAIEDQTSFTTVKHISSRQILDIQLAAPPLAEQKRIAGILKEQMAAVERARASAEAQLQAAEHLPAAYLRAVFDNDESKSWPRKCIGDITSERLIGLVRAFTEQDSSARYPYLKMENITTDGRLAVASRTRVTATDDEHERYSLRKGDFLFNTRNSFELVGKTAVFDLDEKDWLFNNNLMRVRFKPEIDPFFVLFCFHADEVMSQLESFKSNTTSVCAIYDRQFVVIKIPVPPLADQRRIAAQLSSQMASAERLRQMLTGQLDAINKLPAALLRRAFTGEI